MEYLHHFELSEDPFRNDHLERFMAETPTQVEALRRLDRGVRQGRGLVVLTGGVGCGKTTVSQRLYEDLEEEMFEASMMVVLRSHADSRWLLGRFAAQLGVEEPDTEREALIGQIYERLAIIREDGRHAVLIIDDAQALATPETLAELVGLAKLEYEDRRLLTIVLVGSPLLERALAVDTQLAHHVDVKVRIAPFGAEESNAYVAHRLRVAGGDPKRLLPGAVARLHELSEGAPGRLNTLADNALFEAFLAERREVTRSDVDRAHADLGWAGAASDAGARPRGRRSLTPNLAETTTPDVASGFDDLESELEAVFEPTSGAAGARVQNTRLMDFDSSMSRGMRPIPSRATAAPTEIQLEATDALDGPPKDEDEVDGLFMELIDD